MEKRNLLTQMQEADDLYAAAHLQEALRTYKAVLTEDDSIAWAHSRVGAILAQLGDLDGAEEALRRAIEHDPKLPQAHSNIGNICYARGDYEAALAKYKEAVALDANNATFHENLHAAYKKLGKVTEAVAALKQAHRLDRDQAKAETKAKLASMKQNLSRRRGCLGFTTLLVLTLLTAIGSLLIS